MGPRRTTSSGGGGGCGTPYFSGEGSHRRRDPHGSCSIEDGGEEARQTSHGATRSSVRDKRRAFWKCSANLDQRQLRPRHELETIRWEMSFERMFFASFRRIHVFGFSENSGRYQRGRVQTALERGPVYLSESCDRLSVFQERSEDSSLPLAIVKINDEIKQSMGFLSRN